MRLCFGSMKTFKELLGYITLISLLILGLGAGSMWLISPDLVIKAEAKAPVVPQKILDSIERKKPVSVDVVAPAPAAVPAMQESPASLPQPLLRRQTIREFYPPAQKVKSGNRRLRQSIEVPAPAGRAASAPITTSRTDFPY